MIKNPVFITAIKTFVEKLCTIFEDGTSHDLVLYIHPKFLEHWHIRTMQGEANYTEREADEKLEDNTEALLQVDFSETYMSG